MKSTVVLAVATVFSLASGAAWAAPPATLANTTWTLQANQDSVELVIDTQTGLGAPGQAICRQVTSKLNGIAPIKDIYCPSTGRIQLLHLNADSRVTMRVFTGNLSDDVAGQPLFMGGTMTVQNAGGFGPLGEFAFSAVEQ